MLFNIYTGLTKIQTFYIVSGIIIKYKESDIITIKYQLKMGNYESL